MLAPFATDLYQSRCDELASKQGRVVRHHAEAVPHIPDMRGGANSIADGKARDVRECMDPFPK
jgi:hypothetical protein